MPEHFRSSKEKSEKMDDLKHQLEITNEKINVLTRRRERLVTKLQEFAEVPVLG